MAPTKRYAVGDEKLDIPFQVAFLSEDFASLNIASHSVANLLNFSEGSLGASAPLPTR